MSTVRQELLYDISETELEEIRDYCWYLLEHADFAEDYDDPQENEYKLGYIPQEIEYNWGYIPKLLEE